MLDKTPDRVVAEMSEQEAIDRFLKEQSVFLSPDPDIMADHGLAPRSERENELIENQELDRDKLALIRDRLISRSVENWEVMTGIAASPGARWGDVITGIWTPAGDLAIVSTHGVLVFAAITHYALRAIDRYWKDDPTVGIHEGDLFTVNDARWGAIHPADWTSFYPVFHDGELVCYTGVAEHLGENGSIEPGGLATIAENVYGEGLRLPPTKVAKNGKLCKDFMTFLQNMVREPSLMLEDMNARLTVCKKQADAVKEVIADHGVDDFIRSLRVSVEDVEAETKRRIAKIPDGTARSFAFADHTFRENVMIKLNVEIRKKGSELTFDFRGSSAEFLNRSINSVLGSSKAMISNLFSAYIWPDLPRNQGLISAIKVVTDEHSCIASGFESPNTVSMVTLFPIFTAIQEAFAKLTHSAPEMRSKTLAPWYNMVNTYVYGGVNQRGQIVASISANVNGMPGGAREDADGEHSMAATFAVMCDLPEVEYGEAEYPYLSIVGKRLLKDNQGFGKYRGGSGFYWAVSPKDSPIWGFMSVFTGAHLNNIKGLFGGYGCGSYPVCKITDVDVFDLLEDDPETLGSLNIDYLMNARPVEEATYTTRPGTMPFEFAQRGDIYIMSQGAGGGYGDVLERDPEAVVRDVRDNVISDHVAETVYRVAYDRENFAVDQEATQKLRAETIKQRLSQGKPFDQFVAEWTKPGPTEIPVPYFGCWDNREEIFVGVADMPSPADAIQPIEMDDPDQVRIAELEDEVAMLKAQLQAAE